MVVEKEGEILNKPPDFERNRAYRSEQFGLQIERKTTPEGVTRATRGFTENLIEGWWADGIQPNVYLIDNQIIPGLRDREKKLRIDYALNDPETEFVDDDIQAGLVPGEHIIPASSKDLVSSNAQHVLKQGADRRFYKVIRVSDVESQQKREKVTKNIKSSIREIAAVSAIMQKDAEQDAFKGDVENIMVGAFQRLGKAAAETRHFGEVLNLEPGREKLQPLGKTTEKAWWAWRDVAKGRAMINQGGFVKKLPNIYALPPNHGLRKFILDKYIVPSLGRNLIPNVEISPAQKAFTELEREDRERAGKMADILMDLWGFDGLYSLGSRGTFVGDLSSITTTEMRGMNLETYATDESKAYFFEERRQSEFRGNIAGKRGEVREYPRAVGSRISLGCYPRLTSTFLDIAQTEVFARPVNNPNSKPTVISMSIEQVIDRRVVDNPENKITGNVVRDGVTYEFDKRSLGDRRNWDSLTIFDGTSQKLSDDLTFNDIENLDTSNMTDEEIKRYGDHIIDFALGASTTDFESRYKLQGFMAYRWIYAQIMREDFTTQYKEITDGDLLLKMNKGISVAMGMLTSGLEISKETSLKLQKYIRTIFLSSLVATLVTTGEYGVKEGSILETKSQIHPSTQGDKIDMKNQILGAVARTGFLSTKTVKDGAVVLEDEGLMELFNSVIENRAVSTAPRPHELVKANYKFNFSNAELEEIKPLYPSMPL